jgi:hypothetical protein
MWPSRVGTIRRGGRKKKTHDRVAGAEVQLARPRKRRSKLERREGRCGCAIASGRANAGRLGEGRGRAGKPFRPQNKAGGPHTYEGDPFPLGYLTPEFRTNVLDAPRDLKPFTSTFPNGILSMQFVVRILEEDGKIESGELEGRLKKPNDFLRNYLAGGVLLLIENFFAQPGGRFHALLYELEDEQLEGFLATNTERLDLILSDAGSSSGADGEEGGPAPKKKKKRTKSAVAGAWAELRIDYLWRVGATLDCLLWPFAQALAVNENGQLWCFEAHGGLLRASI